MVIITAKMASFPQVGQFNDGGHYRDIPVKGGRQVTMGNWFRLKKWIMTKISRR
jgi:hypothetical protein